MPEIVYILTNECMPGIIKIGKTDIDIKTRMRSLYKTGVPIPFECYYAAEVENNETVERNLHKAFDGFRINNGREFFRMPPENARAGLKLAALKDVTPTDTPVDTDEDLMVIKEEKERNRKIRGAFNFNMVGIEPSSELSFTRDKEIKATVIDNRKIEFRDEITSLSAAANIILNEMDSGRSDNSVQGPLFWKYKGEILTELRNRLEYED